MQYQMLQKLIYVLKLENKNNRKEKNEKKK